MNNNLSFNDGWSFAEFPLDTPIEQMLDSDALKPVDIPHDWMIWHVNELYKDSIGNMVFVTAAKLKLKNSDLWTCGINYSWYKASQIAEEKTMSEI